MRILSLVVQNSSEVFVTAQVLVFKIRFEIYVIAFYQILTNQARKNFGIGPLESINTQMLIRCL